MVGRGTDNKKYVFYFPGIPYQQLSVELKCVVECDPPCEVAWQRNGVPIPVTSKRTLTGGLDSGSSALSASASESDLTVEGTGDDEYSHYVVRTSQRPPDIGENLLHHVESTLTMVIIYWKIGEMFGPLFLRGERGQGTMELSGQKILGQSSSYLDIYLAVYEETTPTHSFVLQIMEFYFTHRTLQDRA